MNNSEIALPEQTPRRRLYKDADFSPWVPAQDGPKDCRLFWMPVSGFPLRYKEKAWITEFHSRWSTKLSGMYGLRAEIFLQYKAITPEMGEDFRRYAQRCVKLLGVGRYAENDLPSFPTQQQVKEAIDSGKPFDFRELIGDYVIWFASKHPEQQRELFLGTGGMTTLFLPPDPKLKPLKLPFTPALRASMPVFQRVDVDGIITGTLAMQDMFLEKSKRLFGQGLEGKPEYPGIAFVLPLLDSSYFFVAEAEMRARWFDLFEVYLHESRKDQGLILAFQKEEYEPALEETLQSMRDDGLAYEVQR